MVSEDGQEQERDGYAKSEEVLTRVRWLTLCHAERAVRQRVVCGAEYSDIEDRALKLKSRFLVRSTMKHGLGPWKTSSPYPGRLHNTSSKEKTFHETDLDDSRHAGGVDHPDDRWRG
jgi:hypothetical protein